MTISNTQTTIIEGPQEVLIKVTADTVRVTVDDLTILSIKNIQGFIGVRDDRNNQSALEPVD